MIGLRVITSLSVWLFSHWPVCESVAWDQYASKAHHRSHAIGNDGTDWDEFVGIAAVTDSLYFFFGTFNALNRIARTNWMHYSVNIDQRGVPMVGYKCFRL